MIENRLLSNGLDTDSALPFIANGSLLNAVNVRGQRQRSQNGGSISMLKGNLEIVAVTSLLISGTFTLLGKCVDDGTGKLYLFYHSTVTAFSSIIEYNATADTARTVLASSMVTNGLGWVASTFIDCEVADGPNGKLLLWADGGELKYVNLSTAYAAFIAPSQLTLITEPAMVPMEASRVNTSGVASNIQTVAVQFSYIVTTLDGFRSVLAPYSLTSLPARNSEILSNANARNSITAQIPYAQKIPGNWKRVEIVARFIRENNIDLYIIKRWDQSLSGDATAVTNHNAGAGHLGVTAWTGATLEILDTVYVAKQFDAIPQAVKRLRLAANRLLIANYTEGYNTPVADPGITLSQVAYTPNTPSGTGYMPYIVIVKQKSAANWYFAVYLRIGIKNYLLPRECSTGKITDSNNNLITSGSMAVTSGLFNIPSRISQAALIELKEAGNANTTGTLGYWDPAVHTGAEKLARYGIVAEANGLTSFEAEDAGGSLNWYLYAYDQGSSYGSVAVTVETDPDEFGPAGENRAFAPGGLVSMGLQYYDDAGRKPGVQLLAPQSIGAYSISAPSFASLLNVTMPSSVSAGTIPDYAQYFSIVLSRSLQAVKMQMFFGGIVKALFKNGAGEIVARDRGDLLNVPSGYTVYGIAVPIPTGISYAFADGDMISCHIGSYHTVAAVTGEWNGHIVARFTDDGTMHTLADGWAQALTVDATGNITLVAGKQAKTAFIVYSGGGTTDLYEVGAFGTITGSAGSKQFGTFFATGTRSIDISGDCHTQKRPGAGGGGLGLAMSPRDDNGLLWVTNQGRTAATDSVGQKALPNAYRWSNVHIPGAQNNGYASFDANDFDTTDITAGEISYLALTTRGAQDGGQLLILCEHGSFSVLVGQQVLTGADGKNALNTTAEVVSKPNPLRGGWGCQSPRAVGVFEGKVWWVDAYKRNIIEFNESGAGNISEFLAARLFNNLLALVSAPEQITLGVDPYHAEVLVSIPATSYSKADLATVTGLPDPLDAATGIKATYRYNYQTNRWQPSYTSGAEFMHVGDKVFGWLNGKLWGEFVGAPGTYYGSAKNAMVVVPFNAAGQNGTLVKSPRTLKLTCRRAPDSTWIVTRGNTDEVAAAPVYRDTFEGVKEAAIMRNRVGYGAASLSDWLENGIRGANLKGEVIVAVLVWNGSNSAEIGLSSAELGFEVSRGV